MNRGALLAKEKLSGRGQKAALARALDIGPDVVSRWLKGERVPDTKQRAHLEDEFGIGWRSWDDPVEGDVVEPAAPPDDDDDTDEAPDSESKPTGKAGATGTDGGGG